MKIILCDFKTLVETMHCNVSTPKNQNLTLAFVISANSFVISANAFVISANSEVYRTQVKSVFEYHHKHGKSHHWLTRALLEQDNVDLLGEYL